MIPRRFLLPLVLFALLTSLSACASAPPAEDAEAVPVIELEGEYRGRYWVTYDEGRSQQQRSDGPVRMRFSKGSYEVQGERRLLPPSGGGDFHIDGRVLVLKDTAMHTADFDWTLILDGRFDIDMGDDGVVRLTQRDLDTRRYHELELSYEGPVSTTR